MDSIISCVELDVFLQLQQKVRDLTENWLRYATLNSVTSTAITRAFGFFEILANFLAQLQNVRRPYVLTAKHLFIC